MEWDGTGYVWNKDGTGWGIENGTRWGIKGRMDIWDGEMRWDGMKWGWRWDAGKDMRR